MPRGRRRVVKIKNHLRGGSDAELGEIVHDGGTIAGVFHQPLDAVEQVVLEGGLGIIAQAAQLAGDFSLDLLGGGLQLILRHEEHHQFLWTMCLRPDARQDGQAQFLTCGCQVAQMHGDGEVGSPSRQFFGFVQKFCAANRLTRAFLPDSVGIGTIGDVIFLIRPLLSHALFPSYETKTTLRNV